MSPRRTSFLHKLYTQPSPYIFQFATIRDHAFVVEPRHTRSNESAPVSPQLNVVRIAIFLARTFIWLTTASL
jgi:hypothetical protein